MTRFTHPIRRALPVAACAGLLALVGCNDRSTSTAATLKNPNRMTAPELNVYASTAGPTYAVDAIVAPPAPPTTPRMPQMIAVKMASASPPAPPTEAADPTPPTPPAPRMQAATVRAENRPPAEPKPAGRAMVSIHIPKIVGTAGETTVAAENDVLQKLRVELRNHLQRHNPPVSVVPSLARIRKDYLPPTAIKVREVDATLRDELNERTKTPGGQWYVAEASLELSEDQVRELRQEERVTEGLIGVGGLAVASLVLCGLLRAGTAAGRFTTGRLRPTKFVALQIAFWTVAPPLTLFFLSRAR